MQDKKINIFIIGAGKGGTELINLFRDSQAINIAAVADINEDAPGMRLAKELNIRTSTDFRKFLNNEIIIDEIINTTGSDDIQSELIQLKPGNAEIIGGSSAKLIWDIFGGLKKAKKELETQTWGLNKTNEAIKLLYKDLEQKNRELQKLDQLKSEFISTVSHELRTPLSIIKEGVSLVLDKIPGEINERQDKLLTTVKDNADRLSRVINDLLDISKIEAGKVELKRGITDIVKLAKRAISSFELKASDKGLQLKSNFSDPQIEAYIDSDKVIQIFTNLIGNALKFTERGFIEISLKEKENEVECCVSDTGKGITIEDHAKVFNKFQQFGRVHGSGERGTGLGLSIVKGIVELHKGNIWFESNADQGSKFYFTLPKYNTEIVLRDYMREGIEDAKKEASSLSLVVISVDNFDKLRHDLTAARLDSIMKSMEGMLANSLLREGDIALQLYSHIFVILPGCDRANAFRISGRLEQALESYLVHEQLSDRIKLRLNCITYPDDAKTDEEMLKKAKG